MGIESHWVGFWTQEVRLVMILLKHRVIENAFQSAIWVGQAHSVLSLLYPAYGFEVASFRQFQLRKARGWAVTGG